MRNDHRDSGSALVEFCVLAMLMMIPLVYLVLALGRIQAGSFAAQGAAREAGRAFATARDVPDGRQRAAAAAKIALANQHFSPQDLDQLTIDCLESACLRADTRLPVRVRVNVILPGVPRGFDRIIPSHLQLDATHVVTIDRFRANPKER